LSRHQLLPRLADVPFGRSSLNVPARTALNRFRNRAEQTHQTDLSVCAVFFVIASRLGRRGRTPCRGRALSGCCCTRPLGETGGSESMSSGRDGDYPPSWGRAYGAGLYEPQARKTGESPSDGRRRRHPASENHSERLKAAHERNAAARPVKRGILRGGSDSDAEGGTPQRMPPANGAPHLARGSSPEGPRRFAAR